MKAPKLLLALAMMSIGSFAMAQTAAPSDAKTIYVYMVAKQDAQHIVISEVMQATELMKHADLVTMFQQNHPEVATPHSMEGLSFATAEEAETNRATLKAKFEKTGKTVTLLATR